MAKLIFTKEYLKSNRLAGGVYVIEDEKATKLVNDGVAFYAESPKAKIKEVLPEVKPKRRRRKVMTASRKRGYKTK